MMFSEAFRLSVPSHTGVQSKVSASIDRIQGNVSVPIHHNIIVIFY